MTQNRSRSVTRSNCKTAALVAAVCIAAVFLRTTNLDSDAFPGLSWSSALLTDEGFYIHNARNLVLFGVTRTDQFNNMMIMPALHGLQVLVFRIWGVGAIPARMITVAASLATLPLFYSAIDRSLGRRTAITATAFLALDHVYFLYNRLALMDLPATSLLIVMLYLWVMGLLNSGWRRSVLLYGCGLSLVLAYTVRGLAAPICLAPIAAIWLNSGPSAERHDSDRNFSRLLPFLREVSQVAFGLLTGIALYLAVWYIPNHSEMLRVNQYYLRQLMPESITGGASKAVGAVFGDSRGMAAYLIRHSSAVFVLALAWITTCFVDLFRGKADTAATITKPSVSAGPENKQVVSNVGRYTLTLAALWLLILWLVLAITEYSPSRYYVLGYPAMAIIGAHALWDMPALVRDLIRKPIAAAFLLGLTVYHFTLVAAERCFPIGSSGPIAAAAIAAMAVAIAPILAKGGLTKLGPPVQSRIPLVIFTAVGVWAIINVGWTISWLGHLTYRQRDADRWLGEHLPANSVLFGAVAPGLCINNHFRTINVIQDLCNDRNPLQQYQGLPKYVLILDNRWREGWWDRTYPGVLSRENRVKTFSHLLRPRFEVGVYHVPDRVEAN